MTIRAGSQHTNWDTYTRKKVFISRKDAKVMPPSAGADEGLGLDQFTREEKKKVEKILYNHTLEPGCPTEIKIVWPRGFMHKKKN